MSFVHLHNHSEYSLLDGANRLTDLINAAKAFNMPAVALTDHGVMYGAVEFYQAALKAGIKPIIGCEFYVAPRSRNDKSPKIDDKYFHLLLLAKNEDGYKNLLKLVSLAHLEGYYYKPRIDKQLIARHCKGLIASSACLKGEIPELLLRGEEDKARELALTYQDIYGKDNFYLEIMDHNIPEQKQVNPLLVQLSKQLHIPLIATNDVHYLTAQYAYAHEILLCIQTQTTMDNPQRFKFQGSGFYFKSPQEMAQQFAEIPQALSNTLAVAEACDLKLDLNQIHLPVFNAPGQMSLEDYLRQLSEEGLARRYPGGVSAEVRERMEYELGVINQMGFPGYFLIIWDFIHYALAKDIPVGPGRGSAAGSLVAYLLGITDIDPLKYGLIFERFLNPERKSMPDIDTDFCALRREEIIQYVTQKYGSERVAQIVTFGRMKARAAVRDAGRVLGMDLPFVDKVAKMIPSDKTLKEAKQLPEVAEFCKSQPRALKLIEDAEPLEGLARNASIHAAGVVIARDALDNYAPLQRMNQNEVVCQYDMNSLANIGLLKMDFLGLRNLTAMKDTVSWIKRIHGHDLDINNLPLDDEKTFQLLREGNTVGVFQLESSGMRRYLMDLKPKCFEDIIAITALYRPGPLGGGLVDDFIKRSHGKSKVKYEHPLMEKVLKETYGVIVYQEQVMQLANVLAGYTMAQADELRKAMGKKKLEVMTRQRESFVAGCKNNKIDSAKANKIFDLMEYFAGYGFNKSHSTAYAMVAYQTAYLKAHYPKEFMAALLTSVIGKTDKMVDFVNDCKKSGMEILPPDINISLWEFVPSEQGIRFGLGGIKNVGEGAIAALLEERQRNGSFKSFSDIQTRIATSAVNKKVLESLIKSGALDCLGSSRAAMAESLKNGTKTSRSKHSSQQISLFIDMEVLEPLTKAEEYSRTELRKMEKEMLGFYLADHPLNEIKSDWEKAAFDRVEALREKTNGAGVRLAGMIFSMTKKVTKKQQSMAILQFEDPTGLAEVLVFPQVYEKVKDQLYEDALIVIKGKLELREREKEDDSAPAESEIIRILAENIEPFKIYRHDYSYAYEGETAKPSVPHEARELHIRVSWEHTKDLPAIKDICSKYKGGLPLFLHLKSLEQETVISSGESLKVCGGSELCAELKSLLGEEAVWQA